MENNFFGSLEPYIDDLDITDINCNSGDVWVTHVNNGRYKLDIEFTEDDIKSLAYKISNTENVQFNKVNPTLQANLDDLRFQFTHESFSTSGTTVSIRKTPVIARVNEENINKNNVDYITNKAKQLLSSCIKLRKNTVICGLTGSGKTELAKYLTNFTNQHERIISIEDTLELHLTKLYPTRDIVELKTNSNIDYEEAIKCCMRMLPVWVLLSEARGKEVQDLIKSMSTGAKIITTLHSDNAKQIPSRILNMFEDNELSNEKIENMVYDYIDIGIHVRCETSSSNTVRYIDQICVYELKNGTRITHEIYKVVKQDGNYIYQYKELPESLINDFADNDIKIDWSI